MGSPQWLRTNDPRPFWSIGSVRCVAAICSESGVKPTCFSRSSENVVCPLMVLMVPKAGLGGEDHREGRAARRMCAAPEYAGSESLVHSRPNY